MSYRDFKTLLAGTLLILAVLAMTLWVGPRLELRSSSTLLAQEGEREEIEGEITGLEKELDAIESRIERAADEGEDDLVERLEAAAEELEQEIEVLTGQNDEHAQVLGEVIRWVACVDGEYLNDNPGGKSTAARTALPPLFLQHTLIWQAPKGRVAPHTQEP